MKKKFFCENCSHAVPADAEICPNCGSSFRAVKCPKCGFTGRADMFAAGCPICGYLSESLMVRSAGRTAGQGNAKTPRPAPLPSSEFKKERKKALPDWFYPLAGVILLGIIIALVIMYLKL